MSTRLLLLTLGSLAASLAAQTPPCESRNDTNTTVSNAITASPFVGSNPNSRAYQFTPAATITPQSVAIFSGSPIHDDFMRLEIWDDDPINNVPTVRRLVGTLFSPLSPTANWLGTNFDTIYTLNPGTNYWLVWVESGASIVAEEPGGTALPRRTRTAANAWGGLGSGAVKFRLFCNLLDAANVTPAGTNCPTSNGLAPTAFTNDVPAAGNATFGIEGTNLPPGAGAWLLLGFDSNFVPTPFGAGFPAGCALNTDIVGVINGGTGIAEIGDQPTTPRPSPFGHVRFNLPIPAALPPNLFFSAQILGLDSGFPVAAPLVGTNAVQFLIP